jgi:hypothetical protein
MIKECEPINSMQVLVGSFAIEKICKERAKMPSLAFFAALC